MSAYVDVLNEMYDRQNEIQGLIDDLGERQTLEDVWPDEAEEWEQLEEVESATGQDIFSLLRNSHFVREGSWGEYALDAARQLGVLPPDMDERYFDEKTWADDFRSGYTEIVWDGTAYLVWTEF